jgi:hypothetical protein
MLLALTASLALFNIPAGEAYFTLRRYSDQSLLSVVFPSDQVGWQQTHAISGVLEPKKALALMLKGLGLESHFVSHGVVVLLKEQTVTIKRRELEPEHGCECIILGGFMRTPYCDDGSPKPQVEEGCRVGPWSEH